MLLTDTDVGNAGVAGAFHLPRPSCELAKRRDFLLLAAACGGGVGPRDGYADN
jgi:hypothetical protein